MIISRYDNHIWGEDLAVGCGGALALAHHQGITHSRKQRVEIGAEFANALVLSREVVNFDVR